ncbi:MAG: hypothetical protein ACKO46_04025, partial [Alphaproteobacteria bacterium]
ENGVIISPLNPQQVWNPRLKLTQDDKERELFIRTGADKILQKEQEILHEGARYLRDKLREKRAEIMQKDLQSQTLEQNPQQNLSEARFDSTKNHNPPHFTGDAVPEDSITKRDPELVYKLAKAMMEAKSGKDFLEKAKELSTSIAETMPLTSPTLRRRFEERAKRKENTCPTSR